MKYLPKYRICFFVWQVYCFFFTSQLIMGDTCSSSPQTSCFHTWVRNCDLHKAWVPSRICRMVPSLSPVRWKKASVCAEKMKMKAGLLSRQPKHFWLHFFKRRFLIGLFWTDVLFRTDKRQPRAMCKCDTCFLIALPFSFCPTSESVFIAFQHLLGCQRPNFCKISEQENKIFFFSVKGYTNLHSMWCWLYEAITNNVWPICHSRCWYW